MRANCVLRSGLNRGVSLSARSEVRSCSSVALRIAPVVHVPRAPQDVGARDDPVIRSPRREDAQHEVTRLDNHFRDWTSPGLRPLEVGQDVRPPRCSAPPVPKSHLILELDPCRPSIVHLATSAPIRELHLASRRASRTPLHDERFLARPAHQPRPPSMRIPASLTVPQLSGRAKRGPLQLGVRHARPASQSLSHGAQTENQKVGQEAG